MVRVGVAEAGQVRVVGGRGAVKQPIAAGFDPREDSLSNLDTRISFAGRSLWLSPATFVWPSGLSPLYELPERATVSSHRFLLPLLGVAATVAILTAIRHRFPGGVAVWSTWRSWWRR